MAITAMGLGTKQAPENVNLDPQVQFWSWLYAYQEPSPSNTVNWAGGYIKGFPITQTTPAGMSVQIGVSPSGGNDCAILEYAKRKMTLLSTDGTPQVVTIPTAPASGSRIDSIVSYVDVASPDPESETPGTPEYVKTVVVSGTAASSPTAPTKEQIQSALPPTVENWYHWADVKVAADQTVINNSNITDRKPKSPNLYWTTTEIEEIADDQINSLVPSLALTQARTVSPRFASRKNITSNSWTAPGNGIVYFVGNINTTQYASSLEVYISGVLVWGVTWNVDAQNYNWDVSGNVLVRKGDKLSFINDNGAHWNSRIFVPVS